MPDHVRREETDVRGRLSKAHAFLVASQHRGEKAAIVRFIATHYANAELDLDQVAAGANVNRDKINDVLKSELGMTFTSYLKKLRLTEAARLLTDQASATVAEIAYSVGYANGSYFSRLFKEEYGCAPKAFRSLASRSETPSCHDRQAGRAIIVEAGLDSSHPAQRHV